MVANQRQGVTRVEVIIAICILCLLFSIWNPYLVASREHARLSECLNNMKGIGLGLNNFHSGNLTFPQGTIGREDLPPEKRWSWYPNTYLYIPEYPPAYLYRTPLIDLEVSWDQPDIHPLKMNVGSCFGRIQEAVPLIPRTELLCPNFSSEKKVFGLMPTPYVGMSGIGEEAAILNKDDMQAGVWGYDRKTKLDDITDGIGQTILLIETLKTRDCWVAGGPATVRGLDNRFHAFEGKDRQFGGLHSAGCPVTFADGSAKTLNETISQKVLAAMCTISGGKEIVNEP